MNNAKRAGQTNIDPPAIPCCFANTENMAPIVGPNTKPMENAIPIRAWGQNKIYSQY